MAGSGHALTSRSGQGFIRLLTYDWVADDADGSIPSVVLPAIRGKLLLLRTNPGATAPTADYDVTLPDADSIDQLQGVGADRAAATTEEALVVYSGTSVHPFVDVTQSLTLTIAGNSVNSATGRVIITYEQGA